MIGIKKILMLKGRKSHCGSVTCPVSPPSCWVQNEGQQCGLDTASSAQGGAAACRRTGSSAVDSHPAARPGRNILQIYRCHVPHKMCDRRGEKLRTQGKVSEPLRRYTQESESYQTVFLGGGLYIEKNSRWFSGPDMGDEFHDFILSHSESQRRFLRDNMVGWQRARRQMNVIQMQF